LLIRCLKRPLLEIFKNSENRKKMTLQDLADLTGLTKGYLSKVERSIKFPPLSTLNEIAAALGKDVAFFFNERETRPKDIRLDFTKKDQGKIVKTDGVVSGYEFKMLAENKAGKNMIPYIIEPAFDEQQVFQHEGEEFLYVLEGTQEFIYDGQKILMEKGDSVYFDAGVPHTGRSLGQKKAKLLAVMYKYKRL
jgi:transcriptional regulator with XRE-family HTH domain